MPLTRFVKTPEQIEEFQQAYRNPVFQDSFSLSLSFLTDSEVARELLPPPLQPADEARVSVSVYNIGRSNCVGAFDGASVNLACQYDGKPGLFCITMPMSTGVAINFGRDLFAEPKKHAEISLTEHNGHAKGTVTRYGLTYIELFGTFEGPMEPVELAGTSYHYYFKHLPAADGRGLAADPELIRVTHRGQTHEAVKGVGSLTFRESPHDPLIDIPVLSVGAAMLSRGETNTTAEVVTTVPAAEFLPYAYAKTDDLTQWVRASEVVGAR